jgi:hypothetical protein
MPVPNRREAARLLRSLDPAPWSVNHACGVADIAAWLARAAARNGHALDRGAVETAALLHDADKTPGGRQPGIRHGDGSAAWLAANGLAELAPLVRDHPVTRLADDEEAGRLFAAPLEVRIVAYADKRAGQRLGSMDERFASWRRRYPAGPGDPAPGTVTGKRGWDHELAERVYERALALEREVCAAAGVAPAEVARLRWARRAMRQVAP